MSTVLRIPKHVLTGFESQETRYVSVKDVAAWLTASAEAADEAGLADISKAYRAFRDALTSPYECS